MRYAFLSSIYDRVVRKSPEMWFKQYVIILLLKIISTGQHFFDRRKLWNKLNCSFLYRVDLLWSALSKLIEFLSSTCVCFDIQTVLFYTLELYEKSFSTKAICVVYAYFLARNLKEGAISNCSSTQKEEITENINGA